MHPACSFVQTLSVCADVQHAATRIWRAATGLRGSSQPVWAAPRVWLWGASPRRSSLSWLWSPSPASTLWPARCVHLALIPMDAGCALPYLTMFMLWVLQYLGGLRGLYVSCAPAGMYGASPGMASAANATPVGGASAAQPPLPTEPPPETKVLSEYERFMAEVQSK